MSVFERKSMHEQLRAVGRPAGREAMTVAAERLAHLAALDVAHPDLLVRRRLGVGGVGEQPPVRRPAAAWSTKCCTCGASVQGSGQPPFAGSARIWWNSSPCRSAARTICSPSGETLTERTLSSWKVVSCSGQPPRTADAPEVELAGDVGREQELPPVGRERERRLEAPDRVELLEARRRLAPPRRPH